MIFEPIDNSSANIVELKVKPRPSADEGAMLQPVPHSHCRHTYTSFEIDIDAGKCVCKKCGEEVTPILFCGN